MKVLVLFILVYSCNLQAQKNWLILATEGYVKQIKKDISLSNTPKLWAGDTLLSNAQVNIPEKAYLALMHIETGEVFELSKKGEYSLNSLKDLKKYHFFDFREIIRSNFSILYQADREDQNTRVRKYMPITGSKYRCGPKSKARIFYPDIEDDGKNSSVGCHGDCGGKILSDTLNITLYNIDATLEFNTYVVRMTDFYEKVCIEKEIISEKNPYKITVLNINMCNKEELLLSIAFKEEKLLESSKSLWLIKKVDTNSVLSYQDIKRIKSSLQKNPLAIEYFLLSKIYEKEGLLLESLDAIQKCIRLQPHVITYANMYHDFLTQYKFREGEYHDKKPVFIFTELNKREHKKYLRFPKKL